MWSGPNVGHHPAAHVVGRGHHRDGLTGDIDAVLQAFLIDVGEAALDEVRRLVADVQIDAVGAGLFHFQVDGPGHRVPGGQVFQGVVLLHEGPPGAIDEDGALPPERLGDEEIFGRGVIEAGGVELDEFHVADPGPGPVGHGDAVSRGDVRVAGVEIDLAHPPGGQEGDGGLKGVHLPGQGVEDVGPQAGLIGVGHHRTPAHQALAGDQVHPHVVFEHPDVGVGQDLLRQDALHFGPGHVLGVDHPPVGMAALPAQIVAVFLVQSKWAPMSINSRTRAGPWRTTNSTMSGWDRPSPVVRVSLMWYSKRSSGPRTAAMPPWALLVEVSVRPFLVTKLTRANSATFKA